MFTRRIVCLNRRIISIISLLTLWDLVIKFVYLRTGIVKYDVYERDARY